jgi:hypothetical protein
MKWYSDPGVSSMVSILKIELAATFQADLINVAGFANPPGGLALHKELCLSR